mmetsp:Transcript_33914/g.37479  ORF Transcript_33914/g.37479 Transcript_33914/m.37479 type:complete len:569 (+) Transcript_33914:106-1812(+)
MPKSKKKIVAGYNTVGSQSHEQFLNNAVTMRFLIHGFGLRKERKGKKFYTGTVTAFGYPWKLAIYPRGHSTSPTDAEYFSIHLCFSPDCNNKPQSVIADATIRTKSRKLKVEEKTYFPGDEQPGWDTTFFSKRDDILLKDCDDNGTLSIDVDIEVVKETKLIGCGLQNIFGLTCNPRVTRKSVHTIPELKKLKFVGCNYVGSPPEEIKGKAVTMRFQIRKFGQRKEERGEKFYKRSLGTLKHPWMLMIFPRGNADSSTSIECVSIYLLYFPRCNSKCQTIVAEATIRTRTKRKEISKRTFRHEQASGFSNFFKRIDILSGDCDKNGTLTIEVDIKIVTEKKSIWYSQQKNSDDIGAKLYNSAETADVMFTVGSNGKEFKAHKCILLLKANALHEQVLMESKKRSRSKEDLINLILPNVNESLFEAMLVFIYTNVEPKIEDETTARNILLVADQFNCQDLGIYTESVMAEKIVDSSNAARLLLFADSRSLALLKEACMSEYVANPNAVMASRNDWTKIQVSNKLLAELLIYTSSGRNQCSPSTKIYEPINGIDSLDLDSLGMSSLRVLF